MLHFLTEVVAIYGAINHEGHVEWWKL